MNGGKEAVTVLGTVSDDLGMCLMHEHIVFDFTSRHRVPSSIRDMSLRDSVITLSRLAEARQNSLVMRHNLHSAPVDVLSAEIESFISESIGARTCTLVDATVGEGRSPADLVLLALRTGAHIIMSTGLTERVVALAASSAASSCAADGATSPDADDPATSLADKLVLELNVGIDVGSKQVRAGLISLGESCLQPPQNEEYPLMLRAIAQAQMRTAAPLLCPLPTCADETSNAAERACKALSLLFLHGVQPAAVFVGHAQHLLGESTDLAPLRTLLRTGVSLVFDGLGNNWIKSNARPYIARPNLVQLDAS